MQYRSIGDGLPPISRLSLGSWNTFSRLSFEENVALIRRALDLGVTTFDVGYYWDKPDTEQMFGRALRELGVNRSDFVLAEKLWLWDYPKQSFQDQLTTSLRNLQLDYVDLVMVSRPLPELDFTAICEEVAELVSKGFARGWGITNWEPSQIRQVQADFTARGLPLPRMVQLQYSVARREIVESEGYNSLFEDSDLSLCAANTLEGGILAGHLDRDRVNPSEMARGAVPNERNVARDSGGIREIIRQRQPELERIASDFGLTAAQAAIAFVNAHPALSTVLVGVTKISDLEDNVAALEVANPDALRQALAPLAVAGVAHPKLFSPTQENA